MDKVNLVLFQFNKERDSMVRDLAGMYDGHPQFAISLIEGVENIIHDFDEAGNGIFLFKVSNKEELQNAISVIKSQRKIHRAHIFKPVCILPQKNPKVEKILNRYGCMEVLDGSITAKALGFKLDFWARPIIGELQKKARQKERMQATEHRKKQESGKKAAEAKEDFKLVDVLDLKSDMWLVKNKVDYKKILRRWMVNLVGPSPKVGSWEELDQQPGDSQPTWRFIEKNPKADEFISDEGAWFFYGSKPEFDWKERKWNFASDAPHLYFYARKEDKVYSKVKFEDDQVQISENSDYALLKKDLYNQSCESSFDIDNPSVPLSIADRIKKQEEEEERVTGKADEIGGNIVGEGSTEDLGGHSSGQLDPKKDTTQSGPMIGKSKSEASTAGNLSGKASTDKMGGGPLAGKASTDKTDDGPLVGKASTDKTDDGPLAGKASTDKTDDGPLAGKASTDQMGGGPLAGKASTDKADDGPLAGKASTDQMGGGPLAGKASTDKTDDGPLAGKASTDQMGGGPLAGKASTDKTDDGPLAGKASTDQMGGGPLAGKASTDKTDDGPLAGKASTDQMGGGPLAGKASTGKTDDGPLAGKASTDQMGGGPLAGKASTDKTDDGPLAGKASTDQIGGGPLAGKASTDKTDDGPLAGKANTDQVGGGPLAGKTAMEQEPDGPLAGKASTDQVGGGPLAGKTAIEQEPDGPLAGKANADQVGGGPLAGKTAMEQELDGPLAGKANTDQVGGGPLAGKTAMEQETDGPLDGKAEADAIEDKPLSGSIKTGEEKAHGQEDADALTDQINAYREKEKEAAAREALAKSMIGKKADEQVKAQPEGTIGANTTDEEEPIDNIVELESVRAKIGPDQPLDIIDSKNEKNPTRTSMNNGISDTQAGAKKKDIFKSVGPHDLSKEDREREMEDALGFGGIDYGEKNKQEKKSHLELIDNDDLYADEDMDLPEQVNTESGELKVIISQVTEAGNNIKFLAEFEDFYEDELVIHLPKNSLPLESSVEGHVNLNYNGKNVKVNYKGTIIESEPDESGITETIIIELNDIDSSKYNDFMELYQDRQASIMDFLKKARGF